MFGGRARLSERGWGADRRAHSCGRGGPFFAWCAASITKAESRIDVDLILYLIYLILSLYLSISIYLSIYLSLAADTPAQYPPPTPRRSPSRSAQHLVTTMGDSTRSHVMNMHRALETTTGEYVERVAQGSDDYSALLRRLEAAHRLPAGRSRAQVGPAPSQLPHMLNAVDTTLDSMIKRLELELQHRTSTDDSQLRPPPLPPTHDAAATALSAQLRRVLASSRSQVERDLLANALREAESETTTVVCSRTPRHAHEAEPSALLTPRGCAQASTQASLTAQLSVSRLLADDLSSLGDELRVRRPPAAPATSPTQAPPSVSSAASAAGPSPRSPPPPPSPPPSALSTATARNSAAAAPVPPPPPTTLVSASPQVSRP